LIYFELKNLRKFGFGIKKSIIPSWVNSLYLTLQHYNARLYYLKRGHDLLRINNLIKLRYNSENS